MMKRRYSLVSIYCPLLIILLTLCSGGRTPTTQAAPPFTRWAYYVPDDKRAFTSLQAHARALDTVVPDLWRLHEDGRITARMDVAAIRQLRATGVQVMPMVQKISWHDKLPTFWTNRAARTRAAERLTALVVAGNYPGLHFDIEHIPHDAEAALQSFVFDLAARLHARNKLFTIALPAKSAAADWYPEFNYANLGSVADVVVIMAYDHGYAGGEPAPVAPLPWVKSVVQYTVERIPPSKVLLGVPWYGYDWNITTDALASYVSWPAASAWGKGRYDAERHAMTLTYHQGSEYHMVWYENARSISAKNQIAVAYGLRGWAAWRLGYEDPALWKALTPRR